MKPWQAKAIADAAKQIASQQPLREDDYTFRLAKPEEVVNFEVGARMAPDISDPECPFGRLMFGDEWPRLVEENRSSPPLPGTVTVTGIDRREK